MNLPAPLVARGLRALVSLINRAVPDSVKPQQRALVAAANKSWSRAEKWPTAEARILRILDAPDPTSDGAIAAAMADATEIMQALSVGIEQEITDSVGESWGKGYKSGVKSAGEIARQVPEVLPETLPPPVGVAVGPSGIFVLEPVDLLKYVDPIEPFTVQDVRAVNWLKDDTRFWIGDAWNNELGGRIAKATRGALIEGIGRKELAKRLKGALGAFDRPDSYWNVVSSSGLVRARSFGSISGMGASTVQTFRFRAVIDITTCFAFGTPVTMADGSQCAIETIQPGDGVMSCKGRPRVVLSKRMRIMRQWVTLDTACGRRLRVTPEHPLLTPGGWLEAGQVRVGERLALAEGTDLAGLWDDDGEGLRPCPVAKPQAVWAAVEAVATDQQTEPAFDLSVQDDRGYIANNVVVHNSDQCRALNGVVWTLETGQAHMAKVMDTQGPELKEAAPWLPAKAYTEKAEDGTVSLTKTPDELAALGVITPPVHGNCRSRIVADSFGKIGG